MAFSIESQTTQISNIFIEEYMPKAQPHYVVVYLYAYRYLSNGDNSLTNQSIAEALDIFESDVIKSWKYWQEQGLVTLEENGDIHFLPIKSKKDQQKQQQPVFQNSFGTPPEYSQEEMLAISKNSPTAKKLFALAQQYLGRTLSYKDMSIVLSLNEWLGLSFEVIELLFSYCKEINHYHIHYIEKVAIGWAEQGITTPESASDYIALHTSGYKKIMQALGKGNRVLTPAEENFVQTWIQQYQFSIEMILIACEKTILQAEKPSFTYVNGILEKWYKNNIKTPKDVETSDQNFQDTKNKKTEQKNEQKANYTKQNKVTTVKRNRFVNYEQRDWDFEELERLARERLKNS